MARGNKESDGKMTRHTVVLPKDEALAVKDYQEKHSVTQQRALRCLVADGAWIDKEQQNGAEVEIVKDGKRYLLRPLR